jgi:hypothetical protein
LKSILEQAKAVYLGNAKCIDTRSPSELEGRQKTPSLLERWCIHAMGSNSTFDLLVQVLLLPHLVSECAKSLGIFVHFFRHISNNFFGSRVGKIGSRFFNYLSVYTAIINDHTRAKVVGVVRLAVSNATEQFTIDGLG